MEGEFLVIKGRPVVYRAMQILTLASALIQFELPPEWQWYPDESGGGAVPPDRQSVLHVRAESVDDPAELPNLSRMMASFLTYHLRPVATDELMPFSVGGGLGYTWQYMEEWEEEPRIQAIRVWVMGNERAWAFANFQGPAALVQTSREQVDRVISSFRFVEG